MVSPCHSFTTKPMKKLSNFFYVRTNGYLVLGFLALQFLFSGLILPHFQKQFDPQLNRGLMDLDFGFSPEKGYNIIESYGEQGRKVYFFVESFVDVLYPIVYTAAFVLMISFLFKKNGWNIRKIAILNILPLAGMGFDMLENFGIVQMLRAFPERVDFWARVASNAGIVKWAFAVMGILLFLVSLVGWVARAVKSK